MKKQLSIIIIMLFAFAQQVVAQRAQVKFKNDIFSGVYSEVYQQPLWITYNVLCPNGSASREGMDFYTNDSIITSDNLDYINNEYDKGHLAPAADFNCDKSTLFKTFSYLNCALQQENLNRGVWRFLETHERDLAKKGGVVTVKIELVFSGKSKKLPTGATIPDGFIKTISINGVVTECYYFPNAAPPKGVKYTNYITKCK
jgi:endonuclease G, mitochondrial